MALKFTKHFGISKNTPISFVDIPIDDNDLEAFICPFLIEKHKKDKLELQVSQRIKNFLRELNTTYIKTNDVNNGISFLDHLHEPNEYHLGYSSTNKGKAVSKSKANDIFNALRNNAFSKQNSSITNEAHNVLLLVDGIGQDIMSDIISNVCRDIFANFTSKECLRLGISTKPIDIEFYNDKANKWETTIVDLPQFGRHIILVPTTILSSKREFASRYNWFVSANYISKEVLNMSTPPSQKMISKMKDGTKKAIIKEIYKHYKKPKKNLVDFVIQYSNSLDEFIEYAKINYPELNLENLN
ncbi:hypothetical protein LZQ00_10825 [Sphingobacterium sp. SRCM116780]|uniref:hypothetical protein n=1 Tax=Sphingobacterium sp. SRCM116780 TaxID=2907623 RepID=UPI001F1F0195|nr:hypothetical protein [Sphingobacterium sp. SRCM116780]UIR54769.1 hypothetical protein LZQ00_10825 [Sphingobacterium sp. SRCM116780]